MKRLITSSIIATAAVLTPITASADSPEIYTSWRNNISIGGYDTVSYFSGKPQKGDVKFTMAYKGADWHFSSQANLDLFRMNPEAFTPAYGGYCAWAIAHDKLAKGSPKSWHVQDGRLFLNFNNRIQKQWTRDKVDFIKIADKNWPQILEK
ncbi:MAG: YHS domain-containing (seleno)protein [Maricaulaceae bacterium]